MGRAHGKKRRMKRKFRYGVNRKRSWKNSKHMPAIKCAAIKEAWDKDKGIYRNLTEMGLSTDPNITLKIPTAKTLIKESFATNNPEAEPDYKKKIEVSKSFVVEALEKEASKPMNTSFHVSNDTALFAKYMVEKYGSNYKAMAKDPKNYYQLTSKQIQRKIRDYDTSKFLVAYRLANKEPSLIPVEAWFNTTTSTSQDKVTGRASLNAVVANRRSWPKVYTQNT